jgi:shikimate kinase
MNCVLIGYRGTGKSTVGRLVADRLDLAYVCLDEEIVRRAGMSVPEIVERHSWAHFRKLEEQVVADHAARDGQVLDTGGGVVTRPVNVENLRRTGVVFLLESTVEDIVERIGSDTQRPSLTGTRSFTDEVAQVLAQREPLYRGAAHYRIDTSALPPEEAAEKIAATFRER